MSEIGLVLYIPTEGFRMALTASARIKLLTAVANHLAAEEWPIIDLTLSQFGLPTREIGQARRTATSSRWRKTPTMTL